MTKEIILKNSLLAIDSYNIKKNVGERWPRFNQEESTIAIYKAMDEYAKQQATSFGVWKSENACMSRNDKWQTRFDGWVKEYTIDQLYDLFIEQQNKEQ